jgi:hypothetical protein
MAYRRAHGGGRWLVQQQLQATLFKYAPPCIMLTIVGFFFLLNRYHYIK